VVTTPTISIALWVMHDHGTAGSTWSIAALIASEPPAGVASLVSTTKPTGWMGAVVPGGRTGRCTPRCPPCCRKPRASEKLPNSGLYAADFAPVGSEAPTWAMTRPMWPGGTCTHG
jgi:hypothetical protein